MVTVGNINPDVGVNCIQDVLVIGVSYHCQQFAVSACSYDSIVLLVTAVGQVVRGVLDTHCLAHINHALDVLFAVDPVLEEHARCAWHGEHIGVQSKGVGLDGVLLCVGALLGVVVLNERHGIAAVRSVACYRVTSQGSPLLGFVINHIAGCIAEWEVEGGTLDLVVHLCAVNPALHIGGVAIPVLTHRELRLRCAVVQSDVRRGEALDHVIAETSVAQVVEQHIQVGFDIVLHILALMVEVAHATPVLARVVVGTQAIAILVGPAQCRSSVVVPADVGRLQLVSHTIVSLSGEVHPVAHIATVVDDHVANGTEPLLLEGADHRAQLRLASERAVVVGEPVQRIISHRLGTLGACALRNPDQVEILRQFIGLCREACPLGGSI